jgi:[ribosomal protein S18]-alanine N-acetyltransferase
MLPTRIRPVLSSDAAAVMQFLRAASWITLESSLLEAETYLAEMPGWLALEGQDIAAFLLLDTRRHPVAEIHTAACADRESADRVLPALLSVASSHAREQGALPLSYIGDTGWLAQVLARSCFHQINHVLFYEKLDLHMPARGNREIRLRPAGEDDLLALTALDRAAFDPLWRNSVAYFRRILRASPHFLVALGGGEIVAYQFSEIIKTDGHFSRLAVLPEWQGEGIGTRLLAEAMLFFRQNGVDRVLLNTQENNTRARRLYDYFGFHPTGERVPVWQECAS